MMFSRHAATRLGRQVRRLAVRTMATETQSGMTTAVASSLNSTKYILAAGMVGIAASVTMMEEATKEKEETQPSTFNQPPPRPDLPTYSLEEVAEHCDEESLWYTFRGGVYDMTFFLQGHPGGAPVSYRMPTFHVHPLRNPF